MQIEKLENDLKECRKRMDEIDRHLRLKENSAEEGYAASLLLILINFNTESSNCCLDTDMDCWPAAVKSVARTACVIPNHTYMYL